MARSTIEVLEDHLERRIQGDIAGDLECNYARDVVLLCEHGVLKGHAAIRNSAKALADQLPDVVYEFPLKQIYGEHALLHWSARSANANVNFGVDTFVIRDDHIVLQTVSYELEGDTSTSMQDVTPQS
jgi:hypothetical protein